MKHLDSGTFVNSTHIARPAYSPASSGQTPGTQRTGLCTSPALDASEDKDPKSLTMAASQRHLQRLAVTITISDEFGLKLELKSAGLGIRTYIRDRSSDALGRPAAI
jgi:hypothetical protein